MLMKEHCGRCRMSFRVERPRYKEHGEGKHQTVVCRCPTPKCGKRFWHGTREQIAVVGIFPADAKGIQI